MNSLFFLCLSDRWLNSADSVHAARPPDHIPPQPDSGERCGALQLQGRGRQGPEVPAHVSSSKTFSISEEAQRK